MTPFLFLAAGLVGAYAGLRVSRVRDTSAVAAFAEYRAGLRRAVTDDTVVYRHGRFVDPRDPSPRPRRVDA